MHPLTRGKRTVLVAYRNRLVVQGKIVLSTSAQKSARARVDDVNDDARNTRAGRRDLIHLFVFTPPTDGVCERYPGRDASASFPGHLVSFSRDSANDATGSRASLISRRERPGSGVNRERTSPFDDGERVRGYVSAGSTGIVDRLSSGGGTYTRRRVDRAESAPEPSTGGAEIGGGDVSDRGVCSCTCDCLVIRKKKEKRKKRGWIRRIGWLLFPDWTGLR